MFSVFLSSYSNTRESLGELEKAFLVLPTSTLVSITRQKQLIILSSNELSDRYLAGKSVDYRTF